MASLVLTPDVLSKIFPYADVKDIPSIAHVSKEWKATLEMQNVEQEIFQSIMTQHYPRLATILSMPDTYGYNWKQGFKTRVASPYEPFGLNQELQKDLETVFGPRGIVAFTNCCHVGCSGAYNEDNFQIRQDDGIYFIRFTLNGMNYDPEKYVVGCGIPADARFGCMFGIAVSYGSLEYLDKHWEQECQLIAQFAAIVGLLEGEYKIHKPESFDRVIMIQNLKPVPLERFPIESEEEDMDVDSDDDEEEEDDDDEEEE